MLNFIEGRGCLKARDIADLRDEDRWISFWVEKFLKSFFRSKRQLELPERQGLPNIPNTVWPSQDFLKLLLACVILLAACSGMSGCQSHRADAPPSIEFTKIPPQAQGGRDKLDTIAGRVVGARPGQAVVIYSHSGAWWVQPTVAEPFTTIRNDGTWSAEIHLGYEYAALLVDTSYRPPPTVDAQPSKGGPIVVAAVAKGVGPVILAPTKPVKFSGYDWDVRTIASDRGGSNHPYSGDNAWTDDGGALHLRIAKTSDNWSCAEVVLNRSLGYGTYVLTVRDISHLEPAAVLSMTTFDEWGGEQYYREMDVEVSRWGDGANKKNAQFVIEPYYHPGNVYQFIAPQGTLTYSMKWEAGRADFKTVRGNSTGPAAEVISEHEFGTGIPSPGQERLHLFFYVVASDKNPLQHGGEVVLEKFAYLP
jgi:hypothetical protein